MPQDGCKTSSANGSSPTASLTPVQLSMFDLPTLPVSSNAISSQASADGPSLCEERGGLTLDLFGQEAAPASPSRCSASGLDTQTHGTFGRLGLGSSASDDLQRSLANSLRQLLAGSDLCEVIWKRWVTPWGRCLSRPHARVRSSFEIGIGLWPTATSSAENAQVRGFGPAAAHPKRGTTLAGAAFWSTASSRDWKDTPGMAVTSEKNRKRLDQLPSQAFNSEVVLWPTARASEAGPDFAKALRSSTGMALPAIAASSISPSAASTEKCGALNPDFVSWLMGFPPAWISCAPSATPSIPDQQPLSSAPPCNASKPHEWSEVDRVGHQWGDLDAKRVSRETVSTE